MINFAGRLIAAFLVVAGLAPFASAHETPIALLQLEERRPGEFVVRWVYQSSMGKETPTAAFPAHCSFDAPVLDCGERGLAGEVRIEEMGERYSGAVIRITRMDRTSQSFTLTAAQPSIRLTSDGVIGLAVVAGSYIPLGFEHILLGVDHLMFVLGLIWLVRSTGMLVKTITSFTVAHSITLAAATLGWMGVPERAVNAAIALSIVYIAIEVLRMQRGEEGLTSRHPWIVAFAFGLLHGFGFAGGLSNIGLPEQSIPAALLFFNVGVELGQLAFVAIVLALQWAHQTLTVHLPRWTAPLPAYAIGTMAMYWFAGRMLMMVPTVQMTASG